jgi:hypothetical protein
LRLLDKALRPCAGLVIEVPIECRAEHQALGILQSKTVNIRDENDEARGLLLARDSVFARLLTALMESPPASASAITCALDD